MDVSSVDAQEILVLDHSRKDIAVAMLHDKDRQWRCTELPRETIIIASAQFLRQASSGHDRFPHLDYQQRNNFCIGWRTGWLHDGTLSKVQRVWLVPLRWASLHGPQDRSARQRASFRTLRAESSLPTPSAKKTIRICVFGWAWSTPTFVIMGCAPCPAPRVSCLRVIPITSSMTGTCTSRISTSRT